MRHLHHAALLLALAVLVAACTPPSIATPASASPTKTQDIQRSKLDIVYSAFVDLDVHKVSSKKALEGALNGVRDQVKKLGGKGDVPTPEFQDVQEPVLADFRKFADAAAKLAQQVPDIFPDEVFRAAVTGMIRQSPDCHTYYYDGRSRVDSRPIQQVGGAVPAPQGQVVLAPDESGLTVRMLDGGIAWIHWNEFLVTGTYNITTKVKAALEKALAAGAKAWLFDMRGNVGGNGPEVIGSYFLNGEAVMNVEVRTGKAGVRTASKEFRLPDPYQLPIALVQNDRGGSAPEILAVYLKETKRGTIVGSNSVGCVGAAGPTALSDGSQIYVAVEEYSGAMTGTRYNNAGVPPDVQASDAQAIDVASKLLRDKIAGR